MEINMKKLLLLTAFFVFVMTSVLSADVQVWQSPSLNFSGLKKVFIMPLSLDLKAGTQLAPMKQVNSDINSWITDGINSSMGKGNMIIKPYEALIEDMKFIYGDKVPEGSEFFKAASEMGYKIFIKASVSQKFVIEHVPETTRTYTEYKEIEKRDRNGKIIETLRIPEEKTEIIPAHDVTYLSTVFEPKIFMTDDPDGDHVAAAQGLIYREYQGGAVMKVVENLTKASMKDLFKHEEEKVSKSKSKRKK